MKKIFLVLVFVSVVFSADATISVINQGTILPKITIEDASKNGVDTALRNKFFLIILADLKVAASFDVIENYGTNDYNGSLNLAKGAGAEILYRYSLEGKKNSPLKLNVKIFDLKANNLRYERAYSIENSAEFPYLAHNSIVDLVNNLKMPPIDWMSKSIIFAQEISPMQSKIVIADYTLTHQKAILQDGLNVFPKWANAEQSAFYYTKYNQNNLSIFKYDLQTDSQTHIIDGDGMLVVSDVNSNGTKLLVTMAPDDQADIYLLDLNSKNLTKITDYKGIDVNGNFVDNDTKIVFVSDRLGYPNIFAQNLLSGGIEQMVYHGKNNNSLSTHNNYIVYSSRENYIGQFGTRDFNIYLISTQTNYIRQLTNGGKNNFPRFSSDGGSIIYIKDIYPQSAIGIIRLYENKSFQFPLKIGKIQSVDW